MSDFLTRTRAATVIAAVLALVATGIVAGAAGDFLIIGQSNNSGSAQTILLTTAGGASFTLKNTTAGQTGQFGWSSGLTGAGRGLYGRADSPDGFGVDAFSNSSSSGGGAALRARSNNNTAIIATASGCTGFIICGSDGVSASGYFFGAGVYGTGGLSGVTGSNDFLGVLGSSTGDSGTGVEGTSTGTTGIAVYGTSTNYVGVWGVAPGDVTIDVACGDGSCDWSPPGVLGTGIDGVIGATDTPFGVGVVGRGTAIFSYAFYGEGNANITGNLSVGSCTGCAGATIATNGSGAALHQGDAVTLLGVKTAPDGSVALIVKAAHQGDKVIGIVDVALTASPSSTTMKASTRKIPVHDKGMVSVTVPAQTVKAPFSAFADAGTTVAANGWLRIITSGLYAYKAASAPTLAAGDTLAVGSTAGQLSRASDATPAGAIAGTYLGKLSDGRIVLMISPR